MPHIVAPWQQIYSAAPDVAIVVAHQRGCLLDMLIVKRTVEVDGRVDYDARDGGTVRSAHPHRSFAAYGPDAAKITALHDLDSPNGERSPLKTMYDLEAYTLLLGVGHSRSTILHRAEHRSGTLGETARNGAPLLVAGRREWVEFDEIVVHDHDFDQVGAAFVQHTELARTGHARLAEACVVPHREMVYFAAKWFATHRAAGDPAVHDSRHH